MALWCFPPLFGAAAALTVVRVQHDLEQRATAALRRAGAVGVTVSFRGQDALIDCGVPVDDPPALAALVADLHGVHAVRLADTCGGPGVVTTAALAAPAPTTAVPAVAGGDASTDAPEVASEAPVPGDATTDATDATDAATADAELVAELLDRIVTAHPLQFAPGGAEFTESADGVLDQIAAVATRYDEVAIEVVGHTDSRGDADDNLLLSEQRAAAVVAALEARGVTAPLTSSGRGELDPVVVGGVEDLEASRRVEFVVEGVAP